MKSTTPKTHISLITTTTATSPTTTPSAMESHTSENQPSIRLYIYIYIYSISSFFTYFIIYSNWILDDLKECILETGVALLGHGKNVGKVGKTSGHIECALRCASTDGCVAWTFRVKNSYCWPMSDDGQKGKLKGWITGTKACGSTGNYQLELWVPWMSYE